MRVIGITGGIGAGKSVVSRILRLRGEYVYDCDYEARRLMDCSENIRRGITKGLGEECIKPDGSLDRRRIAEIVFSAEEKLELLNSLVHSAVRDDLTAAIQGAVIAGMERLFVESAILAGSGLADICSEIWLVSADEGLRFRRAMARGGIEASDLRRRMQAQADEIYALPAECVVTIRNDESVSLLDTLDLLLDKK